ncbi:Uncharacterised protein [Mycobacteroides abscessus subsp. abscessus]|nr:Uncharacterised protein [Mycobacteroides abscessus subsp. abscessus]
MGEADLLLGDAQGAGGRDVGVEAQAAALLRLHRDGEKLADSPVELGAAHRSTQLQVAAEDGRGVGHRGDHVAHGAVALDELAEQVPGRADGGLRGQRGETGHGSFSFVCAGALLVSLRSGRGG